MDLRRPLLGSLAASLVASFLVGSAFAAPADIPPEPGFVVTSYATTQGTPTSLAFGPDTRTDAADDAVRLYVTEGTGGALLAIDGPGQVTTFATGFRSPLGVVAAPNGDLYVADAEAAREGPFGFRPYGRVWRVRDTDGDGIGDQQKVVLADLPNGRHNTNGMAFGPDDGLLYVANGNSTDDGVEGGEKEIVPWSGSVLRFKPSRKKVSLADLPRSALVAY